MKQSKFVDQEITCPDRVRALLADDAWVPVDYHSHQATLAGHLGIDLSAVLSAISAIPLCQRDEAHLHTRGAVARLMARQMPAVTAALQGHVDRAAAVLDRPGRQDLVLTMLVPLVHGVLSDLSGLPVTDLPPETAVSSLFSKAAGVSRRRRMNAELAALLDDARRRYPADPEEDHLARLALAILGRDAMMGTVGLSLGALFEQAAGRPLNQIAPETLPPLTGVPYIDRIARADGTVVRLRLDRFGQTGAPRDRIRYFGAGAHTCLGRPVSLDLWRRLMLALGASARRVRVVELALRRDDVFALPERLIVEVS